MEGLILACVLAVTTPQGQICIKPDGTVEVPAGVPMDRVSRQFWDEIAKVYPVIKTDKCI